MKKLIFNLIGIAGIVLAVVNLFTFLEGDMTGDMTPLILVLVGVIVAIVFFRIAKKTGRTQCPKCGYKYDYDDDVAHEVEKTWQTQGSNAKEYVRLKFNCRCQKCGHEIHFKETYVTQELKGGRVVERDVLAQIRKYFK